MATQGCEHIPSFLRRRLTGFGLLFVLHDNSREGSYGRGLRELASRVDLRTAGGLDLFPLSCFAYYPPARQAHHVGPSLPAQKGIQDQLNSFITRHTVWTLIAGYLIAISATFVQPPGIPSRVVHAQVHLEGDKWRHGGANQVEKGSLCTASLS